MCSGHFWSILSIYFELLLLLLYHIFVKSLLKRKYMSEINATHDKFSLCIGKTYFVYPAVYPLICLGGLPKFTAVVLSGIVSLVLLIQSKI